jgi:hypothetical protein
MLPVYLGYSVAAYSSAGGGGVLYPSLLAHTPGSMYGKVEFEWLPYVPPLLEPLSLPGGGALSLSWRSMPGPLTTLTIGAGIATVLVALPAVVIWGAKRDIERERRRRLLET